MSKTVEKNDLDELVKKIKSLSQSELETLEIMLSPSYKEIVKTIDEVKKGNGDFISLNQLEKELGL